MKRRYALSLAALGLMLVIAAVGSQQPKPRLLLLDWAAKAQESTPPAAVLIELGVKDARPTAWSGRATITGARVVHRQGYRFRDGDQLAAPDGWQASSHRPLRAPPRNPAVAAMEGMAS